MDEGIPNANYGFIGESEKIVVPLEGDKLIVLGLGNMGFHMATNLTAKLPSGSSLVVCEIVKSTLDRFLLKTKGPIEVAETPKEVAEKCVCTNMHLQHI